MVVNEEIKVEEELKNNNEEAGVFTIPGVNDNQSRVVPEEPLTNNNEEAGIFTVEGVNDNLTRQIPEEPVVPEAPIEPQEPQEPVQKALATETPVQEVTPSLESAPAEIKPTKVESAQDIKSKELANKATEDAQITAQQEKSMNEFNAAIKSGNLEDAQSIANDNPDLRGVFNSQLKVFLGDRSNAQYFKKYVGMNNQQMLGEVKSGNLVVGTDQYKLLPPEQRASFEQFQAQDTAITNTEKFDSTAGDKVTNSQVLDVKSTELQGLDLRRTYRDLLNSDEIKTSRERVNSLKSSLLEKDRELEAIEDEALELFNTKQLQDAYIADRSDAILKEKRALSDDYKTEISNYDNLKSEVLLELDFLKFEDKQRKDQYERDLNFYEKRRGEMREDEKLKFLEQNKILAENRALENTKSLYEYQAQLKDEGVTGEWKATDEGLFFLKSDGTFDQVIKGGNEVPGGVSTYNYVDVNGNPISETYDITGQILGASTQSNMTQTQADLLNAPDGAVIPTRLKATTNDNGGKECAEYMNDIFTPVTGERMGDTYQSKLKVATDKTGTLGSMAVWQPNPNNKEFSKFGHAGVIVGESTDGKAWAIKSSNLNGQGQISTVLVPKNVIAGYKTTALFDKSKKEYTDAQTKFLETVDSTEFASKKEIKSTAMDLGLTEEDVFAFKANNLPVAKQRDFQDVLSGVQSVLNAGGKDGLSDALGIFSLARSVSDTGEITFRPGTDAADFAAEFQALQSLLTLPNLDKLSGVLSDTDIKLLKSAATSLDLRMSEDQFKEKLNEVDRIYKKALGQRIINEEDIVYTDKDGVSYDTQSLKEEIIRAIQDKETTPEEVARWKRANNIRF